jgi:hypothetical protein
MSKYKNNTYLPMNAAVTDGLGSMVMENKILGQYSNHFSIYFEMNML